MLLALRRFAPSIERVAWARRAESVAALRSSHDLVDLATDDLAQAIQGADCIVLGMPIGSMRSIVEKFGDLPQTASKEPVVVTDVGSVKGPVVRDLAPLVADKGGVFLGSHPMAGSEKKGIEYAEATLFQKAAVILTPENSADEERPEFARLRDFWRGLGAVVSVLSPDCHDTLVGGISHLPHLVAAALVRSVLGSHPDSAVLAGGGFRDCTRIAGGPEDMWAEILLENAQAVSAQLSQLLDQLAQWQSALTALDREQLLVFLSEARRLREALPICGVGGRAETF